MKSVSPSMASPCPAQVTRCYLGDLAPISYFGLTTISTSGC